jgi:hypothetical protein
MTPGGFTIQPVGLDRLALVRAVLQLPVRPGLPGLHTWLAFSGERLTGGALLRREQQEAAVWIGVPDPYRRQGGGRALLAAVLAAAQDLGVTRLGTFRGVREETGGAFCTGRGWRLANTLQTFETTLDDAEQFFGRYERRLRSRGSIPAGLESRHGREVPWSHFRPLLEREFGLGVALRLGRLVTQGPAPTEWASALMLGDTPVAATLGHVDGDAAAVDAYAVVPEFRRGWAHIVSKYRVVQELRARFPDARRYQFSTADAHGDTRAAARLSAAQGYTTHRVGVEWHYELNLGPAA